MSDTLTRAEIDRARTRATNTHGCTACGSPTAESFDCAEDVVRLLAEREALYAMLRHVRGDDGFRSLDCDGEVMALLRAAGEEDA